MEGRRVNESAGCELGYWHFAGCLPVMGKGKTEQLETGIERQGKAEEENRTSYWWNGYEGLYELISAAEAPQSCHFNKFALA
jgi:hypothetical protein